MKIYISCEGERSSVCERRHTHLAGADVAWPVRRGKPLSVAIDTMVISAAITHFTTGTSWKETDSATDCIQKKTITHGPHNVV